MKSFKVFAQFLFWFLMIVILPGYLLLSPSGKLGGLFLVFLAIATGYFLWILMLDHSKNVISTQAKYRVKSGFLIDIGNEIKQILGSDIELEFYINTDEHSENAICAMTYLTSKKYKVAINAPVTKWSADKIRALIGHEIGHAHLRHASQQLGIFYSVNFWILGVDLYNNIYNRFYMFLERNYTYKGEKAPIIFTLPALVAMGISKIITPVAKVAYWLCGVIQTLIGRLNEYEADNVACIVSSPQATILVLHHFDADIQDSFKDKLMATHPTSEQRKAKIRQKFAS